MGSKQDMNQSAVCHLYSGVPSRCMFSVRSHVCIELCYSDLGVCNNYALKASMAFKIWGNIKPSRGSVLSYVERHVKGLRGIQLRCMAFDMILSLFDGNARRLQIHMHGIYMQERCYNGININCLIFWWSFGTPIRGILAWYARLRIPKTYVQSYDNALLTY
jgi:hypothetical protein